MSTWDGRRATRRAVVGAAGTVLAVAAGSCDTPSATRPGGGRQVQHRFGNTTVPARPGRVVALGEGDMEAAVAVGVTPLAGVDIFGLDRLRPWLLAALPGPRRPELLDAREPPLEIIAALRPDLVLYVNSPGDEAAYHTLSRIAPTVAAPPGTTGSFGVEWRDQLALVGRALGRVRAAEEVQARVEGSIARARAVHPEFGGRTVAGAVLRPDQLYLWPRADPRVQLLGELGLAPSSDVTDRERGTYLLPVSAEREDLLRADVLYLSCVGEDGEVDPRVTDSLLSRAPAVADHHTVLAPGPWALTSTSAEGDYASAFAVGGPLGIPACLSRLVGDLSRAVVAS